MEYTCTPGVSVSVFLACPLSSFPPSPHSPTAVETSIHPSITKVRALKALFHNAHLSQFSLLFYVKLFLSTPLKNPPTKFQHTNETESCRKHAPLDVAIPPFFHSIDAQVLF